MAFTVSAETAHREHLHTRSEVIEAYRQAFVTDRTGEAAAVLLAEAVGLAQDLAVRQEDYVQMLREEICYIICGWPEHSGVRTGTKG